MSHKLLIADYPSCGKCRKESEAVGRCELLRSVITNVDLGQIPVIVSIGGPGRDTNYIERNFATGRFAVIPLNGKHTGNIVLTRKGSTVVDSTLQDRKRGGKDRRVSVRVDQGESRINKK